MISDPAAKWIKFAVQAAVSACLIAFVVRQIDLSRVASLALGRWSPAWLLAALLLFNLSKVIGALRLNLYQRNAGILLDQWENLRLYYAGMFLNLFLPGGIGGDGYKILVLHRRQAVPVKTLLWITLVDRVSGLLILLLLVCALVPFVDLPWSPTLTGLTASAGAMAVVAASVAAHHWLLGMRRRRLAGALAYALAVQCCQLACMTALLACLPLPSSDYPAILFIFLVSSVAATMPISIGGLGAREVVFLYGLQLLRLDPVYGVVAASGFFVITVVSSLLGAPLVGHFSGNATRVPAVGCVRRER